MTVQGCSDLEQELSRKSTYALQEPVLRYGADLLAQRLAISLQTCLTGGDVDLERIDAVQAR